MTSSFSVNAGIVPILVGVGLAVSVGVFARVVGLDRDRAFYPVVTIVIATYYVLFAVIGESAQALWLEAMICGAFILVAAVGFWQSLWVVVIGLAAHGILDVVHGMLVSNPGVPQWWPGFCSGYDVSAAAYLAWLLMSGRVRAAG
jgi:hypothetical protein